MSAFLLIGLALVIGMALLTPRHAEHSQQAERRRRREATLTLLLGSGAIKPRGKEGRR